MQPYRWFTPVAVIGFVAVAALFSIINFASTGYNLVPLYSHDPNVTTSQSYFGDWTAAFMGNMKPSCQPASIPVNTVIYSNNSALQYTLTSVKSSEGKALPSLIYYNNPLENCTVHSIELQMQSAPGRTATQFGLSRWGIDAQAHVSCKSPRQTGKGHVELTLLADYNFVPETIFMYSGVYQFPGRNGNESASLYWGESLLSMSYYW